MQKLIINFQIDKYIIEVSKKYEDVTLFSIGSSFEGRQMYGVKISSGGNKTKPAILIDAGIHAREWVAPTTALYAISRLVKLKSKHTYQNVDWYIIPQINPDGYEFSHTEVFYIFLNQFFNLIFKIH